jgi:hypothetical protein
MQQGLIDNLRVYYLAVRHMAPKPKDEQPLSPFERLPGPPTNPGLYWFKDNTGWREILVQVRFIDGQLTMERFYRDDVPVADAKGYWRGPLRSSHSPLNG